jgi:superoxide dismutase
MDAVKPDHHQYYDPLKNDTESENQDTLEDLSVHTTARNNTTNSSPTTQLPKSNQCCKHRHLRYE